MLSDFIFWSLMKIHAFIFMAYGIPTSVTLTVFGAEHINRLCLGATLD